MVAITTFLPQSCVELRKKIRAFQTLFNREPVVFVTGGTFNDIGDIDKTPVFASGHRLRVLSFKKRYLEIEIPGEPSAILNPNDPGNLPKDPIRLELT